MGKFAYLILAHNNFRTLEKLVGMLDDSRNDIFIHYDKKLSELPEIKTEHSGLVIVPDRIDVRWGTTSQIKALFSLYKSAIGKQEYDFFFVISGTHLPLKDQDFFHDYFSKYQGKTIIRRWNFFEGEVDFKLRRYHFCIDNFQSSNKFHKAIVQKIWSISMFLQKKMDIKRHKNEFFVKADEWAVISPGHIKHLLENEFKILNKYRHTFCSDEFYLASELLEYDKDNVVDDPNLLFMHFDDDRPLEISKEEYQSLLVSPYLFARKFSDKTI